MKNLILKNGKFLLGKRQNNILSAALVLMIMILASAALGLIRDRLLAGRFFAAGNQWQLDVYFAAFRIPDMLFQVLVLGTLSAAFIPVFSEYLIKDEKEAYGFANLVLNLGLVIFIVFSCLIFIFSQDLGRLVTSLRGEQLNLMVSLMRILLVGQIIFAASNFYTAILQTNQRFLLPAIASFLYNFGIILGIIFLTPFLGIYGPVLGVIIGILLHMIIQFPLVKSVGFNHKIIFNFRHPGIKKIGKLMLPRTAGFALDQISLSVGVFIATAFSAGSFSIYNFAQHLSGLPVSLFGLTIGQAALPALAREANSNRENFRNLLVSSIHQVLFLTLPASIILLVLRIPAVRLAFGAKAFPWEATILTGKVVALFSLSIFAQGLIELLMRAFYALQDTKTPLFLKGATVIFNVILSFWLVYNFHLEILGLALAISLSNILYALLLFIFLQGKMKSLFSRDVMVPILKISAATILSGLALWGPMRFIDQFILDTTKTLNLIILTIIVLILSGGVYLGFSVVFKIKQLQSFLDILHKFGQWRQILSESEEVLDEVKHS